MEKQEELVKKAKELTARGLDALIKTGRESEVYYLGEHKKKVDARIKFLKELMKDEFGEGTHASQGFVIDIKTSTQRKLDSKKVKKVLGVEVEKCQNIITITRVTIKKQAKPKS